jgi:hypothetical protein
MRREYQAERVEAEVTRLAVAALEHLDDGNGTEDLEETEPEEELLHSALLHSRIVESSNLQVTEGLGDTRELVDILDNEAGGGEHANTAVLELSLAEPAEVDQARESERIEANVTNEGAIQGSRALRLGDSINGDALQLALSVKLHDRTPRNGSACS